MTEFVTDQKRTVFNFKAMLDETDYDRPFEEEATKGERDKHGRDVEGMTDEEKRFFEKRLVSFCNSANISKKIAKRIMTRYKMRSVDAVTDDPFDVIQNVPFYTLDHAEKFAFYLEIPMDDTRRLRGYIYHAMNKSIDGGNTKVKEEKLHETFMKLFPSVNYDVARRETSLFDVGDGFLTTPNLYSKEGAIANLALLQVAKSSEKLATIRSEYIHGLNTEQKKAVNAVFDNRVSIVTGLGGTGKTKIVISLVKIAKRNDMSFVLLTPTGKAARNLSNVVGERASTIHRFLYRRLGHQKDKLTDCDLVIVDEGYMADSDIMGWLIQEIGDSVQHLVILGDANQLQPVGAGEPAKDLTDKIPTIKLIKNYRSEVTIRENCLKVLNNQIGELDYSNPDQWAYFGPDVYGYLGEPSFFDRQLITIGSNGKYGSKRLNFILQHLRNSEAQAVVSNPYINYGDFCILNEELENMRSKRIYNEGQHARVVNMNKRKNSIKVEFYAGGQSTMQLKEFKSKFVYQKLFRVGDVVMQTENDYTLNIDNGDVGVIKQVYNRGIEVEYAPRKPDGVPHLVEHVSNRGVFENLTLAYALNTHKVQGDEYQNITFVIDKSFFYGLRTNQMFYTALSRAKKSVHIIGDYSTMFTLQPAPPRQTMIADFLEGRYND